MIWLNAKKLEEKIINDDLSEKESMQYYLAILIYGSLTFYSAFILDQDITRFFSTIISIIITIIGFKITYRVNESIDNKDFLKRFVALSWISYVKITIISFGFMAIQMLLFNMREPGTLEKFSNTFFSIFVNYLFFHLIYSSFDRIRSMKSEM